MPTLVPFRADMGIPIWVCPEKPIKDPYSNDNFILSFLACCQGSKPVFIPFSDTQSVFLADGRIVMPLFIAVKLYWKIPKLSVLI